MTKIAIPYGEKMVEFSLPEETFIGMTDPPAAQAAENPEKEIEEAMEHPIGMGGLETVVFPGAKVAVITDDGSRPTPVKMILPILLKKALCLRCPERGYCDCYGSGEPSLYDGG